MPEPVSLTIHLRLNEIDAFLHRGLSRVVLAVEAAAGRRVPVVTTNLKNSIFSKVEGWTGIVGASAKYALFVHEGTGLYGPKERTYTIHAKPGSGLYWDGAPHPMKQVTIKGMHPRPFLKQAMDDIKPKLGTIFRGNE